MSSKSLQHCVATAPAPTVLLGLLLCPWTWGISSAAPVLCSCQSQRKAMPKNAQTTTQLYSWRRQWQPTPVLLPGESHGRRSLVGCCLWGRIESDTTERLHFHFSLFLHWRRKWQPTLVFLPGESQGPGSLVGCRLWGRTESDTTEAT